MRVTPCEIVQHAVCDYTIRLTYVICFSHHRDGTVPPFVAQEYVIHPDLTVVLVSTLNHAGKRCGGPHGRQSVRGTI